MRIIPPLRQVGKFGLFALAFMYPVYLVYVGIAFGGLAFWGFFVASVAVMGIVITRLGYAANFRQWDISLKKVSGLLLAFALALGFVSGLVYLRIWLVPTGSHLGLGLSRAGDRNMLQENSDRTFRFRYNFHPTALQPPYAQWIVPSSRAVDHRFPAWYHRCQNCPPATLIPERSQLALILSQTHNCR
jgi:hypothetical protein